MVRSRVLWILWLIATGICYVAAENAAFLLLAGVSLALPLLAAVPARQAGKKLSAELSLEAFREKGGEAAGKIFIQNDGLYPPDGTAGGCGSAFVLLRCMTLSACFGFGWP